MSTILNETFNALAAGTVITTANTTLDHIGNTHAFDTYNLVKSYSGQKVAETTAPAGFGNNYNGGSYGFEVPEGNRVVKAFAAYYLDWVTALSGGDPYVSDQQLLYTGYESCPAMMLRGTGVDGGPPFIVYSTGPVGPSIADAFTIPLDSSFVINVETQDTLSGTECTVRVTVTGGAEFEETALAGEDDLWVPKTGMVGCGALYYGFTNTGLAARTDGYRIYVDNLLLEYDLIPAPPRLVPSERGLIDFTLVDGVAKAPSERGLISFTLAQPRFYEWRAATDVWKKMKMIPLGEP